MKMTMKNKWKDRGPNVVLDCGDFFISYNPTCKSNELYSPLANFFSSMAGINLSFDPSGGQETALVKDDNYKILIGDHRNAYEKAAKKGYAECLKYYKKNKSKLNSPWSTDNV